MSSRQLNIADTAPRLFKQLERNDVEQTLDSILEAVDSVEDVVKEAAEKHYIFFSEQMLNLTGEIIGDIEEPYLEYEIARFNLQYLKIVEKILDQVEDAVIPIKSALVFGKRKKAKEQKSINRNNPILPQVEERLGVELIRLEGRVEQALDIRRQRAVGFKKYIWRSQDDARVRLSHAMNDDRVFEYDKSPAVTGHPGDDFGCRCRAEILAEGRGEAKFPDAIDEVRLEELLLSITVLGKGIKGAITVIRSVVSKLPKPSIDPKEILNPGGKPIGKPGNRRDVRVEIGGKKAAEELFKTLGNGGKPSKPVGYPGEGIQLPNGGWVGYRPISKSGEPTIDIKINGIPFKKIKFLK